ncbi:hypothetical protein GCM10022268_10000 [Sphingomonas cynarae]|uniref:Uncharacterized protein n=1 Tax=Sphingomonas cynarae TaxID=930197 RepID=A0ABP7DBZ2_9SPHN
MVLSLILLLLALIVCNIIYCGQRIIADWRRLQHAQGAWGMLALSGALIALVAILWVFLGSLAHY